MSDLVKSCTFKWAMKFRGATPGLLPVTRVLEPTVPESIRNHSKCHVTYKSFARAKTEELVSYGDYLLRFFIYLHVQFSVFYPSFVVSPKENLEQSHLSEQNKFYEGKFHRILWRQISTNVKKTSKIFQIEFFPIFGRHAVRNMCWPAAVVSSPPFAWMFETSVFVESTWPPLYGIYSPRYLQERPIRNSGSFQSHNWCTAKQHKLATRNIGSQWMRAGFLCCASYYQFTVQQKN